MKKALMLLAAAVLAASLSGCWIINSSYITDYTVYESGFETDLLPAADEHGRYGYIDDNGNMVIKPQYQDARYFFEGLAAVKQRGKWGYIDKTGELVIACKYSFAHGFTDGHAMVERLTRKGLDDYTRHYGYIDKQGNVVVKLEYESCDVTDNGDITLHDNETDTDWKLDKNTFTLSLMEYEGPAPFPKINTEGPLSDDRRLVQSYDYSTGWHAYEDETGQIVIPFQYRDAKDFSEGLAAVIPWESDMWVYIDVNGDVALPGPYAKAGNFSEGLSWVTGAGGLDFIDKAGKTQFTVKGNEAGVFKGGVCPVDIVTYSPPIGIGSQRREDTWGLVDNKGNVVLDYLYAQIEYIGNGLLRVQGKEDSDFSFGYCDTSGHFIWKSVKEKR